MVGSGALFIAQRAQLREQQGELAIAQEERREQEEDRRKDQGRLVSAWPYRVNSGDSFVRVEYRNGSDEPVFGCNVYVLSDWGPDPIPVRHWLGIVPPGTRHMMHF